MFAGNDDMAAGALAVAHERGIAVPDQLSIVGFDDSDLAAAVWPPLTTVRQPVHDLARSAADLLLDAKSPRDRMTFDTRLIARASTGPAPKS